MLRLPRRLLDLDTANLYCYCMGELARARAAGDHLIVELRSEDEPEDDEDGDDWMPSLLPLRAELAAGDVRALYLGWLVCAQDGLLDDEEPEPLPPPGLSELSASLQALADFLRLGDDLIAVAAEGSAPLKESVASRDALGRWIAGLAPAEKDALLLRLVEHGDPYMRAELRQRFRRETTTMRDRESAVRRQRAHGPARRAGTRAPGARTGGRAGTLPRQPRRARGGDVAARRCADRDQTPGGVRSGRRAADRPARPLCPDGAHAGVRGAPGSPARRACPQAKPAAAI